jgi:hypothetical protein
MDTFNCSDCGLEYSIDLNLQKGERVSVVRTCHSQPKEIVGKTGVVIHRDVNLNGIDVLMDNSEDYWVFLDSSHELERRSS